MKTTNEQLKKSVALRNLLNSDSRHYKFNDEVIDSWGKEYHRLDHDIKLLRFAEDQMGAYSDCFVLYAIACLGVADQESIRMFLRALRDNCAGVTIMDVDNPDYVRERLKALVGLGFIFKFHYTVDALNSEGEVIPNGVTLFTIDPGGQTFMNKVLEKRTVVHEWIQAKPIFELVGWAACSYVAGRVINAGKFIEARQGVFATKIVGTVFMPGMFKMLVDGQEAYIGFINAFLHRGKGMETASDYEKRCEYMVTVISQYFYNRDKKHVLNRLVVIVENNADLVEIADWINKDGSLVEDYDRLYFTGEGAMRYVHDIRNAFLQMKKETGKKEGTNEGYSFVPVVPDFL